MYSGSIAGNPAYGLGVIKINQQGNLIAVATSSQDYFSDDIYSLQLQSDEKLLVGMGGASGFFQNPVRVNSNGSPDASFNADNWMGGIHTMQVRCLLIYCN